MAAYVCPELRAAATTPAMMEGVPCAEMDKEKPVHCAEYQAGDELALEHLAAALTLTPPTVSSVMPVIAPVSPRVVPSFWPDTSSSPGADPPYFRTQRLRI